MSPCLALLAVQSPDPYVQLGSRISRPDWERTVSQVSAPPPDTTRLAVQRAAAERWTAVLDGLRAVSEASYAPSSLTPEGREAVGRIAELVALAAHVRFADGQRPSAVTLLLDGLTMAVRVRSDEAEGTVLASFADHRNDLPLAQCDRVRAAVDGLLKARDDRRLRLLRLHARIEAYRWGYLKPPARLADAAPAAETIDPATGSPFRYEAVGGGYRLYGEAGPSGGRIELGGVEDPGSVPPKDR